MSSTPTTSRPADGERDGIRGEIRAATIGGSIALLTNLALWAGGRACDATFSVTPAGTDTSSEVGIGLVAIGTLAAFYCGWAVFVGAARRSSTWARAVLGTAALVAVASTAGPLAAADDTQSGVLLACMHLVTGAVFVVAASRSRVERPTDE